jgi:endonuclease/exonuclease/phosphatase family metal-dependent hydrolase
MNAGRGDLPRLIDDVASGRLTGVPPRDHLLLLQEAVEGGSRDVMTQGAARGLNVEFVAVRRGPLRTSGNAILATMPIGDVRVVDLPRERQPRAAVVATIGLQGETLFVVCTHLENRLGWLRGLFGDRARGRQAEALLAALPSVGHGIVGGDMNTMLGPEEPAWRALLARFTDTPPDPAPTFRDRLTLDHLFFDLPDGWVAARRVLADDYGSDHRPVVGLVYAAASR